MVLQHRRDLSYLYNRTLLCKQSSCYTFNTSRCIICLSEPFLKLVAFWHTHIAVQNRQAIFIEHSSMCIYWLCLLSKCYLSFIIIIIPFLIISLLNKYTESARQPKLSICKLLKDWPFSYAIVKSQKKAISWEAAFSIYVLFMDSTGLLIVQ